MLLSFLEQIPLFISKEKKVLKSYAKIINNLRHKNRRNFIKPLRESKFRLKEVKKLGFICSNNLWLSCISIGPSKKQGRKESAEESKKLVNFFLKGMSSPSSSITVKTKEIDGNKIDSAVRYSKASFAELYWDYCNLNKESKMCFSSFKKYASNVFKKSFRWTDVNII